MAKEKTEKVIKTECKDYTKVLEHIKYCLYVLIALLAINTIVLLVVNSDGKSTTTSESTDEYNVSTFNSITPSEFMDLANGSKTEVIYLGRETCSYCVKFLPVLQDAEKDYDYTTNYVDVANIETSSADYTSMLALINGMTEKYNTEYSTNYTSLYGYTPMVVIVKDGKIQDIWIGYGEYSTYKTFLEDNGIES